MERWLRLVTYVRVIRGATTSIGAGGVARNALRHSPNACLVAHSSDHSWWEARS